VCGHRPAMFVDKGGHDGQTESGTFLSVVARGVFAREDNMLGPSLLRLVQPPMPVFQFLPENTEVDGAATDEEVRSHMREITIALASQGD